MIGTLIAVATFTFVSPHRTGRIFVADGEPEFVRLAAEDLASDVMRITGRRPAVVGGEGAAPGDIAVATRPDGRREACDASVEGGVLRLTGSDPHGTMACVYSFIENRLGVDPLSFWNGVPYPKREVLSWDDADFHEQSPRFVFRGVFINDEDFLLHWRKPEGSRPVLTSRIVGGSILNHGTMAQVAETLVRMRFNTIIPGSYLDPTDPADAANLEICARRGLYLSQHHHDPLGLSGFMFLNSKEAKARNLKYSYVANPREIEAGWRRAATAYARFPNVIWQIGLRGISDAPAWKDDPSAPRDDSSRAALIARAMKRQMEILDEIGVPRENRHVTATLWGEGSYFMSKGMLEVPEGTTVVYSDNSSGWWWPGDFAAVRPDSKASLGIYYHLNLLTAGPHHVPAIPVAHQYARLREAVGKGATDLIIVNVGNIREFVYNLDAIRRICQNPESFDVAAWERNWCEARFPVRTGEAQIALERYFAALGRHPVHGHPMLLDGHVYFNLWANRLFGLLDHTLADMKLGRKTAPLPPGCWHSQHDDPFAKALFDANLPALGPWEEVLAIAERQRDEYARLVPIAVDLEMAQPQEYRSRAFAALTYPVKVMHGFSAFAVGCVRAAMACEQGDRAALAKALEEAVAGFEGYEELSARYQEGKWAGWLRGGLTVDIPGMVGWARHFLKVARMEEYADGGEFSLYCPEDASDPRFAPDSLVMRIAASRPVSGMHVVRTDSGRPLFNERLKRPTTACLREIPHASGLKCRLTVDFADGGTCTVPADAKLKILPDTAQNPFELLNRKAEGFRGIWYYNQASGDEYVYKYSGGMGVYCAGHIPMGVYSKEADKTFFCFGGTDAANSTLLQSVSYFDHKTGKLARPTIVFDKHTIDAHDNAVMNLDDKGYIYIFSSSHGRLRPSAIARSEKPFDISRFKVVWEGNYSYPQPFYFPGKGFLFLHTRYMNTPDDSMGRRCNCFMTSDPEVKAWTPCTTLQLFNAGHYQRSWPFGAQKVGVALDQHPTGKGLNWRTDVFYMETDDFGKTWRNAAGEALAVPVDRRDNPALAVPYAEKSRNVYIKGVKFDPQGRPIILYTVSKGYRAGPIDGPREWKLVKWMGTAWREIDTGIRSDSNYDFAELYVDGESDWRIIGASEVGPQPYNPGGEIAVWASHDAGETWSLEKQLTAASERNHNYPRQPLNVNPGFYAFWADGHGRKPSISRLYFCDKSLNVYLMPLSFEGDFADPVPYKKCE